MDEIRKTALRAAVDLLSPHGEALPEDVIEVAIAFEEYLRDARVYRRVADSPVKTPQYDPDTTEWVVR